MPSRRLFVVELSPRRAGSFGRRVWRALLIAARDRRLPRWLRVALMFGLLPIPGPVDEVVLLVCAPFVVAHRRVFTDAWRQT